MPRGQNKEKLLEHGAELLYSGGFHATGVQEIADAAGVPKGSFYNYFESKTDFALTVLGGYTDQACQMLEQALLRSEGTPLTRLRRFYADNIAQIEESGELCGCVLGNFCQEMAGKDDLFRQAVDAAMTRTRWYFTECLKQAQAAGEISASHDPDQLARFLVASWQGALTRVKADRGVGPLRDFEHVVFELALN